MKVGPNWFPVTNSGGASLGLAGQGGVAGRYPSVADGTQIYTSQNITVSLTSLPVDARGAYNKSFMVVGTLSAITSIVIEASIHPSAVVSPTYPNMWFSLGTLSTPTWLLVHSGNVRAFRARTTAVSNTDNFDLVVMYDDAG
jgi:hypothetical protein